MHQDIERVLVSEAEIAATVEKIASQVRAEYDKPDKNLLLVCILKGSVVFFGDLMKALDDLPLTIDFMKASSYGDGTTSTGIIKVTIDLPYESLEDYDILVVEDILDTGHTLSYLLEYLKHRNAKSVKLCTLLNKPERREVKIDVDFEGMVIPNEFVVGYGLDYNEKYRNLPYIGILKPEVYSK